MRTCLNTVTLPNDMGRLYNVYYPVMPCTCNPIDTIVWQMEGSDWTLGGLRLDFYIRSIHC